MSDDKLQHLEDLAEMQRERMNAAMSRIVELEDAVENLQTERERLTFRVGKLEECLPSTDDEYETLTRDDKVALVKSQLMERAYAGQTGKAKMDYKDVMWGVFDGGPSARHCYDLMELAAEEEGFAFYEDTRPKQLRVDLDAANANADFFHGNKTVQGEGR